MDNETRRLKMAVTETNRFDVVLGRGKGASKRPGNVYFRQLASEYAEKYAMASTTKEKSEVTETMLARVEANGGRFLQSVAGTKANGDLFVHWAEASRKVVHTKAKQAIRDSMKPQKKLKKKRAVLPGLASGQVGKSSALNVEGHPLQEPLTFEASSMPEHQRLQQSLQLGHLPADSAAGINPTTLQPETAQTLNMLDFELLQRLEHDPRKAQRLLQQNYKDLIQFQQQQQPLELETLVQPYQLQRNNQEVPQPPLQNRELPQFQHLQHNLVHFQQQRNQVVEELQQPASVEQQQLRQQLASSQLGELLQRQQQQQDLIRIRLKQQQVAQLQAKVQQQQLELDLGQQRFFHLRNALRVPATATLLHATTSLLHTPSITAGTIHRQLRASMAGMAGQSSSVTTQHQGETVAPYTYPCPLDSFVNSIE